MDDQSIAVIKSPIRYKIVNGTAYHSETVEQICIILESARLNMSRIKIHYGDVNTGLDLDDSESGTVYRCKGDLQLPKLSLGINSLGGSPILDQNIVKITAYGGSVLYEHFAYHQKVYLKRKRKSLFA